METWTVDKLIGTAQAFDNNARRERRSRNPSGFKTGLTVSQNRKLAFDARKWARKKVNEQ